MSLAERCHDGAAAAVTRDAGWQRAARQARLLAWLSLAYMAAEGAIAWPSGKAPKPGTANNAAAKPTRARAQDPVMDTADASTLEFALRGQQYVFAAGRTSKVLCPASGTFGSWAGGIGRGSLAL